MKRRAPLGPIAVACTLVIAVTWWVDDRGTTELASPRPGALDVDVEAGQEPTTTPPDEGWSDPAAAGEPYPGASVEGLLTFRGNPTRSFHGRGPVPRDPTIGFSFPESGGMCRESTNLGTTKIWCGMGWTGQPAVVERGGRTWAVFGAYDGAIHFVDADTGERILPDFPTGDLIKGSVTIDPDGFPLVYSGSRDDEYRIVSIDGDEAVELWSMHADDFSPVLWNDDWDSSGIVIDDHLFVGGENGQFVILRLHRSYDDTGAVTVDPEVIFNTPSWDEALLTGIGDETVSVESSPTVVGNTVYFANSGGLVQGYDIEGLADGVEPTRTFRFWTGDDTDASIVADGDGMLYVAVEYERPGTAARSDVVGQLIKLDPGNATDPLVWSFFDNDVRPGGIWSTPAVVDGIVYAGTNAGRLVAVDARNGSLVWSKTLAGPLWASPVVVDDVLLMGDCAGVLHAFDVSAPRVEPETLWTMELGGCLEATPAVWEGRVLMGSRAGQLHAIVDAAA